MIQSCWVVSNAVCGRFAAEACHALVILVPFLWRWQWILPPWLLIWLAVWHGCVEGAERPTSAWPSCGSSCSLPAPTSAGSGLSTRPSSELLPHWAYSVFVSAPLLGRSIPNVLRSLPTGPTAPSTSWLSSSSSWHRWWSVLSRPLAFLVGECGKDFDTMCHVCVSYKSPICAHNKRLPQRTSFFFNNTLRCEQGSSMWANMTPLQTILCVSPSEHHIWMLRFRSVNN